MLLRPPRPVYHHPRIAHIPDVFPVSGNALELPCGRGRGAVWLGGRGLDYWGVDVSPVAIDPSRQLNSPAGMRDFYTTIGFCK